jgi:hypothetical protein
MAVMQMSAGSHAPGATLASRKTLERRRDTIAMVRWALILACAYLIVTNPQGQRSLGHLAIAFYFATNLFMSRVPPEQLATQRFYVATALLDTLLIGMALHFSGQATPEVIMLAVAVLILAMFGTPLASIARLAIALSLGGVLIRWMGGASSLWDTSALLRVPLLLSAALLYGSLVESAVGTALLGTQQIKQEVGTVSAALDTHLEGIRRCQATLGELAAQTEELQARIAKL